MPERGGHFRDVPYMGVIWVVAEAVKRGFWNGNPDWCNLGQGQPEIGEMPGAPERIRSVTIEPEDQAYGPINGTDEMRQAVANHYNRLFRQGRKPYACVLMDLSKSLLACGSPRLARSSIVPFSVSLTANLFRRSFQT